jgi:hypothetical protein
VPGRRTQLDASLAATLSSVPDGPAKQRGIRAGASEAAAVLAERAGDGLDVASVDIPFTPPPPVPGVFQLTPPLTRPVIRAGQGSARPFLLGSNDQFDPGNVQRPRLQPHDPGLVERVWYGGGSLRSMRWAGEQGLNLLTGNIVTGETSDEFTAAQLALIKEYRSVVGADRPARVALGRVIVPFDSATAVTRTRYGDYAASRYERTLRPQGPRRMLFAQDVTGTAEQILDQLSADPVLAQVSELRLELPYEFDRADYEQILHDARHLIARNWAGCPDRTRRCRRRREVPKVLQRQHRDRGGEPDPPGAGGGVRQERPRRG